MPVTDVEIVNDAGVETIQNKRSKLETEIADETEQSILAYMKKGDTREVAEEKVRKDPRIQEYFQDRRDNLEAEIAALQNDPEQIQEPTTEVINIPEAFENVSDRKKTKKSGLNLEVGDIGTVQTDEHLQVEEISNKAKKNGRTINSSESLKVGSKVENAAVGPQQKKQSVPVPPSALENEPKPMIKVERMTRLSNEIPSHEEIKNLSTRQILDENPDFQEYLGLLPKGVEIVRNPDMLRTYYEAFASRDVIFEQWKNVVSEEIQNKINLPLEEGDFESFEKEFDRKLEKDPQHIVHIRNLFEVKRKNDEEIPQLEEKINALGVDKIIKKIEELEDKKDSLQDTVVKPKMRTKGMYVKHAFHLIASKALKFMGAFSENGTFLHDRVFADHFGSSLHFAQWQRENKESKVANKERTTIQREIDDLKDNVAHIESLQNNLSLFRQKVESIRSGAIMRSIELFDLRKILKDRAVNRLKSYISVSNSNLSGKEQLAEADEMNKFVDDLIELQKDANLNLKIDPKEIAAFKTQIDTSVEESIAKNINEIVNNPDPSKRFEKGQFTQLEKDIDPFFARDRIGSKEGNDLALFIIKTLEQRKDKVTSPGMRINVQVYIDEKKKQLGITI